MQLIRKIATSQYNFMRSLKEPGLLVFLLISVFSLSAEPYYFRQYDVQDGLSNNIINCITQDHQGFIWIATRDGLNRFDGYSFRVFRNDPDDPQSIGNNSINHIATDKNGVIWVATSRGFYKYNDVDERFSLVPFSKDLHINHIHFDNDGDIWLTVNGRLVKYSESLGAYQTYTLPDNAAITSFCITPIGNIWVALSNGMLYEYHEETGDFTGYDLFERSSNYTSRGLTKISSDFTGNKIFIGTAAHGAKIFDVPSKTYKDILQDEVKKKELSIQGFLQHTDDELWMASESGLFIYSLETDSYLHIVKRPYDPYSISTNALYNFFKDQENGIWIGSYAGGLNYYSPFQPFQKYYAYPGANAMQGEIVHDICTDQYDNLWIATEDAGVNKLDAKSSKYINFQPNAGQQSITRFNIHGLVPDGDQLWVGAKNSIDVIDIPTNTVKKSYHLPDNCGIVIMKKLPNDTLLVGTTRGMFSYSKEIDDFRLLPKYPTDVRIQSILLDYEGVIWVGTNGKGVYYYDPDKDECMPFTLEPAPNFNDNIIGDIFEDSDKNLWFATFSGLKKYNRQTKEVVNYHTKNGMPSNTTFRIQQDKNSNLWISTTNGLVCLNPDNENLTTYTYDHGLITNQFNYNSSWMDDNGRMYFGMVKGMISFVPEEIKAVEEQAVVYFTKINLFDTPPGANIRAIPISSENKLELTYSQSTFSIDFSSLSYIAPQITKYAFQMEGLDNNWTYLPEGHTAHFTKLPPGKYRFLVKGTNASGIWNDNPTTLQITITPPWWISLTAQVVYLLLIGTVCAVLIFYFLQQNKRRIARSVKQFEDKKEKELYQAKIDFFISIAHEIRTPLTLITIPLEKVLNNKRIPEDAKSYLCTVEKNANRLLDLVNQLLDFRKTELDGYRLAFVKVDVVALLKYTCLQFEDAAAQQQLTFRLRTNVDKLEVYIDKEACTKIISNLLTNALKYAASVISISFVYDRDKGNFSIGVSNDGLQIPPEIREKIFEPFFRGKYSEHEAGTGLGLPLARSLAEMHRGSLILLDEEESPLITFKLTLSVSQPDSIEILSGNEVKAIDEDRFANHFDFVPTRPTILIVEDNDDMKDLIGRETSATYNILMASDGDEALILLHDYSIQLVVSDVMMPVMDGFTLLKKIKTDLEYSHIPVMMLTAKNTTQARLEGLELGADAYLEKPFSMDIMLAQIANLLNNRNSIRNFYFHSPIANMKSMAYSKADESFLEKLNDIILEHIADINLDVEMLAEQMNLSRPTLYRKINALSNLTPNDLIRITRLKRAAELILQGGMKIYEISDAVGFNSQSYFSRSFTKQFGMSPSEYARKTVDKIATD